jgi:hypothetical protein
LRENKKKAKAQEAQHSQEELISIEEYPSQAPANRPEPIKV